MQTILPFNCLKLALLGIPVLVLLTGGCGERVAKLDPQITLKLDAIREADYPVTLAELDAWYVETPPAENGVLLSTNAFAALASVEATSPSYLAQNQKTLELLHVAASWKTCRYPIDLTKRYDTFVPHLSDLKTCVKLLSRAVDSHAAKREIDLATQSLLDGLRLAQSVWGEPYLISHLILISSVEILQTGLESILNDKALTDEQLLRLQAVFSEMASTESMTRSLAAERCMGISLLRMPIPDRAKLFGVMKGADNDIDIEAYLLSSNSNTDFHFFLDRMDESIGAMTEPFPKGLEAISQWDAHMSEAKTKGYLFSGTLLPELGRALYKGAEHVGRSRVTQTALAVERFRLAQQNALPASLAELVPRFVDVVPTDPFDGQPLRYKKTSPHGFVIYSIGKDRNDDGGTPRPAGAKTDTHYDLTLVVRR
jgi:hypothetical protein